MYYIVGFYILWIYYLAVMNLKRAIDNNIAPPVMKWLGYLTVLPPAVLLDWLMNIALSLPFWNLPAKPFELVTGRLKRYAHEDKQYQGTWRQKVAYAFALILDAADPSGKHI